MHHRILSCAALLLLLLPLQAATANPGRNDPWGKIEPLVLEELTASGQTDFFIWLVEKADLGPAYRLQPKEEKGRFVYETLRATAGVRDLLVDRFERCSGNAPGGTGR
jgi:hypothetical protein